MIWSAFFSYVIVCCFSPGPNNLISATIGSQKGVWGVMPFTLGVMSGVFIILTFCVYFVDLVFSFFPSIERFVAYLGVVYLFYLAYKISFSGKLEEKEQEEGFSFLTGISLQFMNPKFVIYALTVTSAFVVPYTTNKYLLLIFMIALSAVAFLSTFSWAILGSFLRNFLKKEKQAKIFNAVMSLLLVYTALAMLFR